MLRVMDVTSQTHNGTLLSEIPKILQDRFSETAPSSIETPSALSQLRMRVDKISRIALASGYRRTTVG
jgi:hypothetical protein